MLTDRQRRPHLMQQRRTVTLGLLLLALAVSASPSRVAASTLASQRAQAARVMAQLDLLQTRRDEAAAAERAAAERLAAARALVASSRVQIAAARNSLAVSQTLLANTLVSSYKAGSSDVLSYVFSAGSFSDLLTRVDLLNRAASADRGLIAEIQHTQKQLTAQLAVRRAAASEAAQAHAATLAARDAWSRAIAHRQAVLASVNAQIRTMLAHEQQRRRGLAGSQGGSSSSGGDSSGGAPAPPPNVFYGECTWYGPGFAGHPTASGEPFDPNALTAASPWLPFGTQLKVTDLLTGLTVQVRVNDRGPFGRGVLDLSAHAAQVIHLSGWQRVRIEILSDGPSLAHTIMP
jgi:rare lipoprotein A (peptidoglycan hydrolase)